MVKLKCHDRFVLITEDRSISFLFKEGAIQPFAVVKSGDSKELGREYANHKIAFNLFPESVPQLYYYDNKGETASLCIEYVNEMTMSNVVATSWFRKKRRFIKEAQSLLALLVIMMEKYTHEFKIKENMRQQYDHNTILNIIGAHFDSKAIISNLRRCFDKMIDARIPLIMQHGDFCVNNILYANHTRKMVIDWEDSRDDHLPLLDFNMLLISFESLYPQLFPRAGNDFFQEMDMHDAILSTQNKIITLLGINNFDFQCLSLLSTAYLCAQNLKKERLKTASKVFNHLERQVRDLQLEKKF